MPRRGMANAQRARNPHYFPKFDWILAIPREEF
jgi:hypothetical protein